MSEKLKKILEDFSNRQKELANGLREIRKELEDAATSLVMSAEVSTEIAELSKLISQEITTQTTKEEPIEIKTTKKNVTIDEKRQFLLEQLSEGNKTKKALLDIAREKLSPTAAPIFLDKAIELCEEAGEIFNTGETIRRSAIYALAK